jgi:hypothetical protein
MDRRIRLSLFVIASFAIVPPVHSQASSAASAEASIRPASVSLKGVVRNPDGDLLSAVEIVVDSMYRDITNDKGEFLISGLHPGILSLTARRVGYSPVSTAIQADSGVVVQLAIKLVPSSAQLEIAS